MPGAGGHRFVFVDREPLVLRVVAMLLFVNTFLGLLLDFGAKYFFPRASMSLPPVKLWRKGSIMFHRLFAGLKVGGSPPSSSGWG
jgi:hypothetical protein